MDDLHYLIEKFELKPHIEGGFFAEVYRSSDIIKQAGLPERYDSDRTASTSIYFLLTKDKPSKFHIVNSDEIWNFLYGSEITLYLIDSVGKFYTVKLGSDFRNGCVFQHTIEKNTYMAASITGNSDFALVGCICAPGFEYSDFRMADRDELLKLTTIDKEIIDKLT